MGNAPLGSAGHEDIEEPLLRNKELEDDNWHNADDEESPLFRAVDRERYQVALLILEKIEGNPDTKFYSRGRKGMNVLHAAVIRTQKKFVEKISKQFPDAIWEADNDFGWTPLHYAALFNDKELVKLFLKNSPSPNNGINDKLDSLVSKEDKEGMLALHISAKEGSVEVLKILFDYEKKKGKEIYPNNLNKVDRRKRTALHLAVLSGKREAVKIFLQDEIKQDKNGNKNPVDRDRNRHLINVQDKDGNTPLHLAAINGHYGILMMLAFHPRIDRMAMNNKGMSAADIILSDEQEGKDIILFVLKTHHVLLSLEKVVETKKVKIAETKEHGKFIQEREGNDSADKAGTSAVDSAEKTQSNDSNAKNPIKELMKDVFNVNSVVATLIAAATFSATMQVPGGYDGNGKAILFKNTYFKKFLIFDFLAFGLSLFSVVVQFGHSILPRTFSYQVVLLVMASLTTLSVVCLIQAFIEGLNAILPEKSAIPNFLYGFYVLTVLYVIVKIYYRKKNILNVDNTKGTRDVPSVISDPLF
ncbi:ankyrin repeat-containing protein At5g02620-like isoform X3 [Quercus lobata]|uniref:ankyrin repeat-containing protein At5g02620-like isoform X3 n=1 Tax=Quercus lobata TaxID=97700 RepID=UPI0012458917|nr:ankyrin repeat-containing protein At5g02620-like isoform X3 [Quercus lobata]